MAPTIAASPEALPTDNQAPVESQPVLLISTASLQSNNEDLFIHSVDGEVVPMVDTESRFKTGGLAP